MARILERSESRGRKREGLTKREFLILHALSISKYLSLEELAERVGSTASSLSVVLGSPDPRVRERREKQGGKVALLSKGWVMVTLLQVEGIEEVVYTITDRGKQALIDEEVG